jgi:hypothetical protein
MRLFRVGPSRGTRALANLRSSTGSSPNGTVADNSASTTDAVNRS